MDLNPPRASGPWIRWFRDTGIDDVPLVGGKNASLGEMVRSLAPQGIRVPDGFAVTAQAYRDVLERSGAEHRLREVLSGLDVRDVEDLAVRARAAREIVLQSPLPPEMAGEIVAAYRQLREEYGGDLSVAVRSSATAEDLPTASFAGQHETFLNVSGEAHLLDSVRRCFASLFMDRAITYRADRGIDHFKVYQSVGVMKMVRADLACSGVIFTLDTETGFRDVVFVTGAWGLGENVVQGTVDPDEFLVFKPTLREGHRTVLRRKLGSKEVRMVYARTAGRDGTRNMPTAPHDRERFCLTDAEVIELAESAVRIEQHYSERAGMPMPMDIEWARDGVNGSLYILQARPETVASRKKAGALETYRLEGHGPVLAQGRAVGERIASGRARVVTDPAALDTFRPGEVLVAETTMPDWGTVMKSAAAVVTNRGGRTCHAAIVAREIGIPAVVGCVDATSAIRTGDEVTVVCSEGSSGRVLAGLLPFSRREVDLTQLRRPQTEVMVNIGDPDAAFNAALLPCDGVGLARMEFIITEHVRAHPMALLHPERIDEPAVRAELQRLAAGHAGGADYFVRQLSEGIGTIAAAFYPRPVIVRLSDFKTNEYASLPGGRWFEPREENPMIGWRGASRYAHPGYAEGFGLECAAIARVRGEMGLRNLKVMVPFCRRVEEGERVLQAMASHGLARGDAGLEVYVMCEIPNNVLSIDAFARLFDGFSIGSNDLTQLVLGVDRDSEIVAFDFDEHDPGVKDMLRMAIEGARRNKRHVGICGQIVSDDPAMAAFVVELGIDSVSVTPDALLKATEEIAKAEAAMGRRPRDQARP
ncbi:phosphoenolpyruvate synthase [Ramlibacter sp. AW1]|uniref:Phosphoenolpyruvate synthase n=1 Tax=Ramlibacter aurantiacus TaxID=2801330 RepID=A0A937D4L6_9BURK|nr:phosphoenolpyruvate synthase [Ramlibacter aurantiacus]MBL0419018.1 phosphoenolpyruvate synthase [Ramlibacter aurantiacus]